jgi:glycerol kinase
MLFNQKGQPVATAQRAQTMHYPRPGWVELDMDEVWQRTQECIHEALGSAGASSADVAGIGITNERETVVLWDRRTGHPVARSITWQDTRTAAAADAAADGRHPSAPAPDRPTDLDVFGCTEACVAARPGSDWRRRPDAGTSLRRTSGSSGSRNLTGGPQGGCTRPIRRTQAVPTLMNSRTLGMGR